MLQLFLGYYSWKQLRLMWKVDLEKKFAAASESLRRGIMFPISLNLYSDDLCCIF